MNEVNHNQNINLSFLASHLTFSGMKTQKKCRMKIHLFSKQWQFSRACASVYKGLTIPPGQRSGKKSFLCGCIHLWNGLMSVHHLNCQSCLDFIYDILFPFIIPYLVIPFSSSSLSPSLLMSPCLVLFLSSCSTSSSLPHAPSPAPCLSKTAGRTLRSAKLPRLHKPGEMDDSECTAALGICQVDNPQKNGIS